jgi:alpha-tubulin suppressor-like RCC1 family protein
LGAEHTCGRLTDGTVYCWGYNQGGMLGDGTTVNQYYPAKVIGLTGVVQIEVGGYTTAAR